MAIDVAGGPHDMHIGRGAMIVILRVLTVVAFLFEVAFTVGWWATSDRRWQWALLFLIPWVISVGLSIFSITRQTTKHRSAALPHYGDATHSRSSRACSCVTPLLDFSIGLGLIASITVAVWTFQQTWWDLSQNRMLAAYMTVPYAFSVPIHFFLSLNACRYLCTKRPEDHCRRCGRYVSDDLQNYPPSVPQNNAQASNYNGPRVSFHKQQNKNNPDSDSAFSEVMSSVPDYSETGPSRMSTSKSFTQVGVKACS